MIALKLTVIGRVQGVGFRWQTQRLAIQMRINGWVRNENDGSVTVIAEGQEKVLHSFIEKIQSGYTPYIKVTKILHQSIPVHSYHDFTIRS